MSQTLMRQAQVDEALARSTLYRFVSLALLPPGEALLALGADEAVLGSMHGAARILGGEDLQAKVEAMNDLLRGANREALQQEYETVFGHLLSKDCPLNETQYGSSHVFQQAQQLADIAGFYQAFGLEIADGVGEHLDHITIELEFMHVLTFREAYARMQHGPDEVGLLRDAQRGFLADHLRRWIPTFARLVGRKTAGFYWQAADLAFTLVAAHAAAFGLPVGEDEFAPPSSVDPGDAPLPCGAEGCPLEPQR